MKTHPKTKGRKAKGGTQLSNEQQQHYIEIAAYYLAEKSEPGCGHDLENWLAAEAEIDRLLAEGKL